MRKTVILICAVALLFISLQSGWAWEPQQEEEGMQQQSQDINTAEIRKRGAVVYDPSGRRDPFRDLMAGQEVPEGEVGKGISQMSIDDIVLIGITKTRGRLNAIINGPQGFPYTVKTGDKFADGFVLSIDESKVVFRKTRERGVPLYKPKDVTKEINPEER
jgi:Tfp pilus assembly protein PilP